MDNDGSSMKTGEDTLGSVCSVLDVFLMDGKYVLAIFFVGDEDV